jgi:hypothetical protein
LALRIVRTGSSDYTVDQVIRFFAEKAGGAHYARRIPRDILSLLTTRINEVPVLANGLRQLGDSVYLSAVAMLQKHTDLDLFLHFALVRALGKQDQPDYLVDIKYPDAPSRLSMLLKPDGSLVVAVQGIDARKMHVSSAEPLDWSHPHYVRAEMRLTDRLESELALAVEDRPPIVERVTWPIFLPTQIRDAIYAVNASAEGAQSSTYLALAEKFMLGSSTDSDIASVSRYLAERAASGRKDCVIYTPTGSGVADVGTNDLASRGRVIKGDMDRLLAGEYRSES